MRFVILIFCLGVFSNAQASLSEEADSLKRKFEAMDTFTKLSRVNLVVNNHLMYKSDQELFKKPEHWAGPETSWALQMGDCEEYVLLKEYFLSKIGVSKEDMRYLIYQGHIRLLVTLNHITYVLDNQTNKIKRFNFDQKFLSALPSKKAVLDAKFA